MDPEKIIVVATDLSARSDRAVDRALLLGEESGATVRVVHVVRRRSMLEDKAGLIRTVRDVLPDPDADVEITLGCGSVPTEVARAGVGSALIVTGVARLNSPGDFLLGTTVEHLIREGAAPVLVVKRRPHSPYRKLLVATDFSGPCREALLAAARLFPNAAIRLFHAYGPPPGSGISGDEERSADRLLADAQEEAEVFLADDAIPEDLRLRLEVDLNYGLVELVINDAVARYEADLVVLGASGKGAVERALIGSTAEHLLTHVRADTLVVREAKE